MQSVIDLDQQIVQMVGDPGTNWRKAGDNSGQDKQADYPYGNFP